MYMICIFLWVAKPLRDGIKSYCKFAIFTRLKIDFETPPPLSLVQFFQRPGHKNLKS